MPHNVKTEAKMNKGDSTFGFRFFLHIPVRYFVACPFIYHSLPFSMVFLPGCMSVVDNIICMILEKGSHFLKHWMNIQMHNAHIPPFYKGSG